MPIHKSESLMGSYSNSVPSRSAVDRHLRANSQRSNYLVGSAGERSMHVSDIKRRGTRTVLWLALLSTFLGLALLPPACFAQDVEVTIFGPKQYTRRVKRAFYYDSFAGVSGKGEVIIQNGDSNGNNLVKDAVVLINGFSVFDASKMQQPGYTLEVPISMNEHNWISVQLIGEPESYITVQAAAEIAPDATTTQVIGIAGGTVSVQNHVGDTFTLTIPPLALDQDTSISVSALPSATPSPIAQNLYPGAVLGPSGLVFSLPVTVAVILHQPLTTPGALLFSLKDSNYALPTANQTAQTAKSSIQGQIYHLSPPISVGIPTEEEIQSMVSEIEDQPYTTPEGLLDGVNSLLSLGTIADTLGYDITSFDPVFDAQNLLESGVADIIRSPLPDNPCGAYSVEMGNLYKAWDILGLEVESGLDQDLLARICKFSVTPPSLNLQVGETSQQAITASLLDPNGNQRSCEVINWYSANLNVVTIAPSGMVCVPTGVAIGVANVSANCDGLLPRSTTVSVCSLSGTWQGPYSGDTLSCAERGPNGVCIQIGPPKTFSGTVAVPFTQTGTTVIAVIDGITLSGTNVNGAVTLGPIMVPCNAGTSTCPAGIVGTLAPDCSSFSGYFYDNKPRTATGTFTFYPPAAQ